MEIGMRDCLRNNIYYGGLRARFVYERSVQSTEITLGGGEESLGHATLENLTIFRLLPLILRLYLSVDIGRAKLQ